ncbi:MAG: MBL fold metallo-hydrolase [Pseudomonadota bacterium]
MVNCFAAALMLVTPTVIAHELSEATYIGNEGVLVAHGPTRVLFDTFYDQSYGTYVVPPASTYEDLEAGDAPFDGIDAVFVSHVHGDHFSAERMLAYLHAQPQVQLYGPEKVVRALRDGGASEALLERVSTFAAMPGDAPERVTVGGVHVEVVAVPHANPQRFEGLQNLIFRVTLDQALTVMHLGDADPDPAQFSPHEAHWRARRSNLAMPPDWFFKSPRGRAILDELNAEQVIGIHVAARAQEDPEAYRESLGGDAFVTPGETREISHQHEAGDAP